jgi:spore coat polysaccharide biosynthesis protein SpsF
VGGYQLVNTGIILQARMGSSRLPGKILKPIGDRPLLSHIFYRLSYLRYPAQLVLATSELPDDDIVAAFCKKNNVKCFRGSEEDVLERYYQCASQQAFNHIVRITGDNPFLDIEEIDRLIDLHMQEHAAYSHSYDALPWGCASEIFTFEAMEQSFLHGRKPHHREHVNEYIQENPDLFSIASLQVPSSKNRPDIRLTVDTQKDYEKACFIVEQSNSAFISTEEAIEKSLCFESSLNGKAC